MDAPTATRPKRKRTTASPRPRKPGRPRLVPDETILDVARNVFRERGIRATTAEVAERAGVSEGTIFHRFGSKDALFRAAIGFDPLAEPPPLRSLESPGKDLRVTLTALGEEMISLGRLIVPVMMMSWSNPAGEYALEKLATRRNKRKVRVLESIEAFFAAEQRERRIGASADPALLARVFMGSIHHFCMSEVCLHGDAGPTASAFVQGLVDLVLRGTADRGRTREARL